MNKSINTALLSVGMSGQVFHAPFIQVHEGFNLYAVWERTKNIAIEKFPDAKQYRDIDCLLADENIELVIVNTPNTTHFDFTKKALLAGKHVVVEKPFTITVAEADELIVLAKQQKKLLSVYQNRRWDSDFLTVKKVVADGWLGDLREVEFRFERFKSSLSPKRHKEEPGPGAGILKDLGPHLIDQALHLFGMPQKVFADVAIMRPFSKVDDYFEILLYYPSLRVRLTAGYHVKEPLPSYVLHGSKGSFIKPRADVQEAQLQQGMLPADKHFGIEPSGAEGLLHVEKEGNNICKNVPTLPGNYLRFYDGIYEAIRNGAEPPVTAHAGRDVIKIIEASIESSLKGCVSYLL